MIPAPRNVSSFCICHSRHSPSGGFLNTLIHDREGFTPATNDRFTMYTFTTACNHAECQQTVYIKKEGKKHSQRKKSWVLVCVSGHTLGFHPLPYTTLSRYSMASKRAGWFLLSISTHDLLHSGLGYHVSGTSKSLAELSEMLPAGERSFFILLNFLAFFLPSEGDSAQESVCSSSGSEISPDTLASMPASA